MRAAFQDVDELRKNLFDRGTRRVDHHIGPAFSEAGGGIVADAYARRTGNIHHIPDEPSNLGGIVVDGADQLKTGLLQEQPHDFLSDMAEPVLNDANAG